METKTYNFSSIHLSDLRKIVNFNLGNEEKHEHKFDEWFGFAYPISQEEEVFLTKLIKKHYFYLPSYSEEKLKMRFLSVILNQVDFSMGQIQDWYDAAITGIVNKVELRGFADFMVAKGAKTPEKPYFFIQEFKPTQAEKDVEDQLLAEMLIAIENNQSKIFRGGYIIGQYWKFVILEKIAENDFEYFVSESFDSLKLPELKQIYINLQAVKLKYCVD